jgi:hypothetical protein
MFPSLIITSSAAKAADMIALFNAVTAAVMAVLISMDLQSVDLSQLPGFGSDIRLAQCATL